MGAAGKLLKSLVVSEPKQDHQEFLA